MGFESEDASTTIDEAQTPVATANIDEVSCTKFLNLTSTKVSLTRTDIKST